MIKNLTKQKKELKKMLKKLGYGKLRFSLLNKENENREVQQFRIDYEDNQYFVYQTSERAGVDGNVSSFSDFEEAKQEFFVRIQAMVNYNTLRVKNGEEPEYPCAVWDKVKRKY